MEIVTITVKADGEALVRSPYGAKDLIKGMPDRRWSKSGKYWVVPARDVPILRTVLETAGYHVIVTQPEQPGEPHAPGRSWAELMFSDLGPDLGEKAYKALVRVLHPDVGGSTAAMQGLNQARDRMGARS